MLFGYPIAAVTSNNWLHECLVEMVRKIHEDLSASRKPPDWPEIIPEMYRERVQRRTGLCSRFLDYQNALLLLPQAQREQVLQALHDQNQIAQLLSGQSDCQSVDELPRPIQEVAKNLFHFAYTLISDFPIRSEFYRVIYDAMPAHICPICGVEYFDAPGAPSEDFDHFILASKYPFAAVNLRNLVPMGHKCNSRYKHNKNVLWRKDGTRRKVFDPYNHSGVQISLDRSLPFAGKDGRCPQWEIDFSPDCEESETWDEVFEIRTRYVRDVLDACFQRWLDAFAKWCLSFQYLILDDRQLLQALEKYSEDLVLAGLDDRGFLKVAVFRMLYRQCANGDQRLAQNIKGTVFLLANQRLSHHSS